MNVAQQYQQTQVMTASHVQLIVLLYDSAVQSLELAREGISKNNYRDKARFLDRAMALLFHVTGETPPDLPEILRERTKVPFVKAGFQVQLHELSIRSSMVFLIVATKSPPSGK